MRAAVLAFVAAIAGLQYLAALPPIWPCPVVAMLAAGIAYRWLVLRGAALVLCAAAIGLGYGTLRAEHRLADRLDPALEQRALTIEGRVADLPQLTPYGPRIRLAVERAPAGVPTTVLLMDSLPPADWRPGQRWRLSVKLKRPHGAANPGGGDYEAFLLADGVGATGMILNAQRTLLADFVPTPMGLVNALRSKIATHIRQSLVGKPYAEMLVALVVGDQSGVSQNQWQLMQKTGAVHLVVVSGMHITLLAGVVGGLFGLLWRRSVRLTNRLPARQAALIAGLLAAVVYALLAGLRPPTERALWMLAVTVLGLLMGRSLSAMVIWCAALGLCVAVDPWAVLSMGFWLSFLTVGALLWVATGRLAREPGWRGKLRWWGASQWAATLGSAPILLFLFQQMPVASILAYASAIPLACGLVTPLALLGSLDPTGGLLQLAHAVLSFCIWLLTQIARANLVWRQASPPLWALLLAAPAVMVLLLPRGAPAKRAACLALLPMLLPLQAHLAPGAFRASVYDVGQGLAVLVRTSRHALLFDTASAKGAERELPTALQAGGVQRLDQLVLSDADEGDSGGAATVLSQVHVDQITASTAEAVVDSNRQPIRVMQSLCRAGVQWEWDGVRFAYLAPTDSVGEGKAAKTDSCVLKVTGAGGSLLLPANIEQTEQRRLLDAPNDVLRSDVMLMPHHGAKGAWLPDFLTRVSPRLAVVSVAYLNPYRQPRADVMAAYHARSVQTLQTDYDGDVELLFDQAGWHATTWRQQHARYWNAVDSTLGTARGATSAPLSIVETVSE